MKTWNLRQKEKPKYSSTRTSEKKKIRIIRKSLKRLDKDLNQIEEYYIYMHYNFKIYEVNILYSILLNVDFITLFLGVKSEPVKLIVNARNNQIKAQHELWDPHPFDQHDASFFYIEGHILSVSESGPSDLIEPCHEFKALKQTEIPRFVHKVIHFGAACMNKRSNGTIHFGILNKPHGEIYGVLDAINERKIYDKELRIGIKKYFENHETAMKCFRPPRFVEVLKKNFTPTGKFVIEVDIVPCHIITKDILFYTFLSKTKTEDAETKNKQFYVRDGSSSRTLLTEDKQKTHQWFVENIKDLSELRKQSEEKHLTNSYKLQELKLYKNIYNILHTENIEYTIFKQILQNILIQMGVKFEPPKLIVNARNNKIKAEEILCDPHPFGLHAALVPYVEGHILSVGKADPSDLTEPCHEFRAFTNTTNMELNVKTKLFVDEVIPFLAACLNSHTNGTIHFGIEEKGRIYGVTVHSNEREEYEEKLLWAIEKWFGDEHQHIVILCVRPPRFVEVVPSGKFVIEVDVVPHHVICKDKLFYTGLSKKKKIIIISQQQHFFVRDGSTTRDLLASNTSDENNIEYQRYVDNIKVLTENRKQSEDKHLSYIQAFKTNTSLIVNNLEKQNIFKLIFKCFQLYFTVTQPTHNWGHSVEQEITYITGNKNNPKAHLTIEHLSNASSKLLQLTSSNFGCEDHADQIMGMIRVFSSLLYPIPISLLKTFYRSCKKEFLHVMNCSLQTDIFPAAVKAEVVRLLLKGNFDLNYFNDYRSVSNLPFLSKIFRNIFLNQLNDFFDKNLFGFRMNYSTETAMSTLLNHFGVKYDSQKETLLVLLDLSGAFDTVNHTILLTLAMNVLFNCILDIKSNFLQLNQKPEIEVLVIGPEAQRQKLQARSPQVKNLGIIFDSYIQNTTKHHLKNMPSVTWRH
ncbi:hypothetical protein NL108_018641 [Boleophthalmus pectinirostris]|uniref:uncharacterized protein LOC129410809 n=1 Tax=Boleophthalmus pectinirostris TaxID=150288 RepID=UPI00242E16B9|nr:uncharacterized protein LOC129410809 [Boleophthalmus pectinirostris]KAJ0037214.1 hypothetical protein NL108_018641 [Boleophthalmus pectinirostris]